MTAAFFTKDEIAEYGLSNNLPTEKQVKLSVNNLLSKLDKQIYNATNQTGLETVDPGAGCDCAIIPPSGGGVACAPGA